MDAAAGYSTSDTESTYVESQTQVDEDKAAESFAAGKVSSALQALLK